MTGSSNLTKNTNAGQSNLSSPLSKVFPLPSPPSSGIKLESPTLLPLDLIPEPSNRANLINGVNANTATATTTTADTVTVTHFSEKRGTMEKISVPSLNIFNAEFKIDANKPIAAESSTNPFLDNSPVVVTSTNTNTNPFHVSLTTSQLETEPVAQITDHLLRSNDVISICSDNNNTDTNTDRRISKKDSTKLVTTNPFSVAIDEIDADKMQTNNNDAFNNLKNNNVNDKAEPSLDEMNKNKKNIEVN